MADSGTRGGSGKRNKRKRHKPTAGNKTEVGVLFLTNHLLIMKRQWTYGAT